MGNNIVLIGMPGAGKSTVGVLLAKSMNYDFVDTDLVIQQKCKKKLYEIINAKGIEQFLKIEDEIISNINVTETVIATGGSVIFGKNAMSNMQKSGIVVYLKLSCDEIIRRVNNIKTRGIAMGEGKNICDIYNERIPLYEKYADLIIDVEGTSVEECVSLVMETIVKNLNKR